MKMVHTGYDLTMEMNENQIIVLSIENRKAYSEILQDMWNQIQGGEGHFILSDKEKQLKISKEVECIFNPFSLDCNDRKILNKLYQELKEQSDSFQLEKAMVLNTSINRFLDGLLMQMPYALKYNPDFDLSGLLKLYDLEVESSGETVLERIVEYLRVMTNICGIVNYVFVGLKQYLSEPELEKLYEFVFYEKINLIIIEAIQTPLLSGEKGWIIDKDLCIIELDKLTALS